jgi:hypothetical protein
MYDRAEMEDRPSALSFGRGNWNGEGGGVAAYTAPRLGVGGGGSAPSMERARAR